MAGVLVVAETNEAGVTGASLELLGAARQLAGQGAGSVSAFIAAGEAEAKSLIAHGADAAYTSSAPAGSLAEVLAPAVEAAIAASGADVVLISMSSLGRDLGPMLAFRQKTGVAMDCTDLKIEGGRLRATRSCYGGNARAEHTWKSGLQLATVKGKTFDALEADASRSGSVSAVDGAGEARITVLGTEKATAEGIKLEDAQIVVSGGRGLGDPSAFKQLEELAAALPAAAVGASRAACDLGWYPPSQQVGLTGKVVSPALYIAVAISGASQHMAGMGGSKNIVAINKDGDANMVKVSKFAIVDDYKKVLPALIEEIKKLG
ncbi:MAG: electron transfer flavoprotein subunit alpha/FixB family protein [Dehalococcoidia bacterium]